MDAGEIEFEKLLQSEPWRARVKVYKYADTFRLAELAKLGPKTIPYILEHSQELIPAKLSTTFILHAFMFQDKRAYPQLRKSFEQYTEQNNEQMALFSLECIIYVEIGHNTPEKIDAMDQKTKNLVFELLNHPNEKIKATAFRVAGSFSVKNDSDFERFALYVNKFLQSENAKLREEAVNFVWDLDPETRRTPLIDFSLLVQAFLKEMKFKDECYGLSDSKVKDKLRLFNGRVEEITDEFEKADSDKLEILFFALISPKLEGERPNGPTEEEKAELALKVLEAFEKRKSSEIMRLIRIEKQFLFQNNGFDHFETKSKLNDIINAVSSVGQELGVLDVETILSRSNASYSWEFLRNLEEKIETMDFPEPSSGDSWKIQIKEKIANQFTSAVKQELKEKNAESYRKAFQRAETATQVIGILDALLEVSSIPKAISNQKIKEFLGKSMQIAKKGTLEEQARASNLYKQVIKRLGTRVEFRVKLPPKISRPKRRPGDRTDTKKFRLRAVQ